MAQPGAVRVDHARHDHRQRLDHRRFRHQPRRHQRNHRDVCVVRPTAGLRRRRSVAGRSRARGAALSRRRGGRRRARRSRCRSAIPTGSAPIASPMGASTTTKTSAHRQRLPHRYAGHVGRPKDRARRRRFGGPGLRNDLRPCRKILWKHARGRQLSARQRRDAAKSSASTPTSRARS